MGVFYEKLELNDFPMDTQELSVTVTSAKSMDEVRVVEDTVTPCAITTEGFQDQQSFDLKEAVQVNERVIHDTWRKCDRHALVVSCLVVRKPGYWILK